MKPYGYVRKDGKGLFIYGEHQFQNAMGAELMPVYLHPKEWVGLTDEQIFACENSVPDEIVSDRDWCIYFARAIEQALKEKNT